MLTVGSLFSGIGGFDLGLERAGMTIAWQVEIDDYCNRVLAKHWPNVQRYRDVRDCGAANLAPVDLICGGFPCQPFSVAGKRGGASDDRYLWPEMRRIIAELRPRWVVAENVPGIINLALDTVLTDLESEGYEVGALVLPACGVGAWHIRQRVWIVANRNGAGREEQRRGIAVQTQHFAAERAGGDDSANVADTHRCHEGRRQQQVPRQAGRNTNAAGDGAQGAVADAERCGCRPEGSGLCEGGAGQRGRRLADGDAEDAASWWETESELRGVPDGLSSGLDKGRVNRLKGLGNAVVPQLVEVLGRMIIAADAQQGGDG